MNSDTPSPSADTADQLRFPRGLYGVTPDWDDFGRLRAAIEQAASGGMSALQWRHKSLAAERKHSFAEKLQTVCRDLSIPLIINDDWALARDIGADGVHLGRDDASPQAVRASLGQTMIIGASCYGELERARQMLSMDVDYIAFGAMFASGTKPQAPPAPKEILTQARELTQGSAKRPAVIAIGGITTANAAELIAAGADSLAVIGGLFLHPNIQEAARLFNAEFKRVSPSGLPKVEKPSR
jgi:thiamine-phosphate pyrophosphorylase